MGLIFLWFSSNFDVFLWLLLRVTRRSVTIFAKFSLLEQNSTFMFLIVKKNNVTWQKYLSFHGVMWNSIIFSLTNHTIKKTHWTILGINYHLSEVVKQEVPKLRNDLQCFGQSVIKTHRQDRTLMKEAACGGQWRGEDIIPG